MAFADSDRLKEGLTMRKSAMLFLGVMLFNLGSAYAVDENKDKKDKKEKKHKSDKKDKKEKDGKKDKKRSRDSDSD